MRKLAIFSVFQITAVLQKRSYYVLCSRWRISMDNAKQQETYSALVPTSKDSRPGGRGNPNPDF